MQIFLEYGNQDHSILHANAKERDEADFSRDSKIHIGNMKRQNYSYQSKWDIYQYNSSVFHIAKHDEKQNENSNELK